MTKQDFMEQLIEELYRYFSPEQYQLEGSVLLKTMIQNGMPFF